MSEKTLPQMALFAPDLASAAPEMASAVTKMAAEVTVVAVGSARDWIDFGAGASSRMALSSVQSDALVYE
ncbi:hypothetical protein SBP02_11715 [Pseudomonas benzenivorans]|uniref:Uncharacterized protein n=1 Tax=Pseudomonas benzenivorans TaxID=556533 RepID=A0ABZ0PQT7_9PSED|nr:hypothetical protein [Pseudomonas benzenivorans]WPC03451.1 hypothetical protein SBP02_11715 [Pseudomonas benzenivorans]